MTAPQTASSLPTRQQLDEIDALLRRMLSLPTVGGESPPQPGAPAQPMIRETTPPGHEPAVQSWRVEWPQQTVSTQPPSVIAWGAPVTAATITSMPIASAVPMAFAAAPMSAPFAVPMCEPAYRTMPAPAGHPTQPASFVEQPPPSAISPPTPSYIWPMVVINSVFDVLSYLIPFGAWMRGSGRPILGWLGMLMFLGACGWAFGEWSGYEWPKVDIAKALKLK